MKYIITESKMENMIKEYILNDDNNWVPPTPIPQEGPVGVGSTGVGGAE